MLQFVLFAVVFAIVLVFVVIYLFPGSTAKTTIPGVDPSDAREGNLLDIIKNGSLAAFLVELHSKFGEVASFWLFGPTLTISVSTKKSIEQLSHLSDKPTDLYEPFKSFVGKSSIIFLNDSEARKRRVLWKRVFDAENADKFDEVLDKQMMELLEKWANLPRDEHIPVTQFMKAFIVRLCLTVGFGDYFKNSKSVLEFGRTLEVCWLELENRFGNYVPDENSLRQSNFVKGCSVLREEIMNAVRRYDEVEGSYALLEPIILSKELKEEEIIDDCMSYILKTYSLSTAASWILYELASKTDEQEQLSKDRKLIDTFIAKCLCHRVVEPWTARVNNHVDEEVSGHIVPKGTPIVFALNVALSNENDSDLIFGCKSSKRFCPANYFSMKVMRMLVEYLTNNFELNLVSSDFSPRTVDTIIGRSEDELWITVNTKK